MTYIAPQFYPPVVLTQRVRPNVWPLWVWWVFFLPVTIIWAPIKAGEAKRLGFPTGAYWAPFWVALATVVINIIAFSSY